MSVIDVAVDESEKEQFGLGDARQCLRDWSGHCDKLQWWVKWLRQGPRPTSSEAPLLVRKTERCAVFQQISYPAKFLFLDLSMLDFSFYQPGYTVYRVPVPG